MSLNKEQEQRVQSSIVTLEAVERTLRNEGSSAIPGVTQVIDRLQWCLDRDHYGLLPARDRDGRLLEPIDVQWSGKRDDDDPG